MMTSFYASLISIWFIISEKIYFVKKSLSIGVCIGFVFVPLIMYFNVLKREIAITPNEKILRHNICSV